MDLLSNCKNNFSVCATGFTLGIVLTLILVYFYNKKEGYINTAANLQPGARAIIAAKLAADPLTTSNEGFKHNKLRAY